MNPVFIFLVLLAAFVLWILISFAFPWLGGVILKIFTNVKYNSTHNERKKNDKEKKDEE